MNIERRIELTCRRADVSTFAQLGFVNSTAPAGTGSSSTGQAMTHAGTDDIIICTMLALAYQGRPFIARVVGLDRFTSILIAGDGHDVVVVPAICESLEPAIPMNQQGHWASNRAQRYWTVKANFQNALVRAGGESMTEWIPMKTLIRQRRQQLGLSQTQLSQMMGTVSSEFICMVERGRRSFDADNIPRLAQALQVYAQDLCVYFLFERSPILYAATFGGAKPPRPRPVTHP